MRCVSSFPCAFVKNFPESLFPPLAHSLVETIPTAESSFKFPKTILWTLTAAPFSSESLSFSQKNRPFLRYSKAFELFQESKESQIASKSCSFASSGVSAFIPRFRIVSASPGIGADAPVRTETKSGFFFSPKTFPVTSSNSAILLKISSAISAGSTRPFSK